MTNQMIYNRERIGLESPLQDASKNKGSSKTSKTDQYMDYAKTLMNKQLQGFSLQVMQQSSVFNYNAQGAIGGNIPMQVPTLEDGFKQFYKEMELGKLNVSKDDKKKLELMFTLGQRFMKLGRPAQAKNYFGKIESLIGNYEGLDKFSAFKKEHGLENKSSKDLRTIKDLFDKMNQYKLDGNSVKTQLTKEALFNKIGKQTDYPAFDQFVQDFKLDDLFNGDDEGKKKLFTQLRNHFDKATKLKDEGKTEAAQKERDKLHEKLDKYLKYRPFESISKTLKLGDLNISQDNLEALEKDYNTIRKLEGGGQSEKASEKWTAFLLKVDTYFEAKE
tara:strand:+ start:850 stop:1845 length:996 start_codon:yes stop_codon:yes gene_type:complete